VQNAVREATAAGGGAVDPIHDALTRISHKVAALAGDSARAVKQARAAHRTAAAQHDRQQHAAQRRNSGSGGDGRLPRAPGGKRGKRHRHH